MPPYRPVLQLAYEPVGANVGMLAFRRLAKPRPGTDDHVSCPRHSFRCIPDDLVLRRPLRGRHLGRGVEHLFLFLRAIILALVIWRWHLHVAPCDVSHALLHWVDNALPEFRRGAVD